MVFAPTSIGVPVKAATLPSIKRRVKNAVASSPRSTSQPLSKASLQKAFVYMLACVSVFYFLLIFVFFFQRYDLRVYRDRGDFNHSIRSNTAEAWKHQMEKLAREQDEEQQRLRDRLVPVQSHSSDHHDLEQPDIEEMIRPEEIRKRKDGTSKQTNDQSQHRAMTAFASSNLDNLLDAGSLKEVTIAAVSSCSSSLHESLEMQTLEDPFLPKLHRVVQSPDASYIQIAAENPIPCGNDTDPTIMKKMHLQAALFQPVSVKRIEKDGETKYQVISDKDDISDIAQTRFLCRFEPSGQETLSSFSQQEDTKEISASANLFFQCPIPQDLIQSFKKHMEDQSEQLDFTLTLVPFRTPPSAQSPEDAMPPCYLKPENESSNVRRQSKDEAEYLPKIASAGRWENIPICLSSPATST